MTIAKYIMVICGAFVMLTACSENPNKADLISALCTANSVLDNVESLPVDSVNAVRDRLNEAKEDVRWLGVEGTVIFMKDDSPVITELSKASRYLKDAPSRIMGLKNECARCKNQINGLIAVIDAKATIDSRGDTITDAYITENTLLEVKAVEDLVEAFEETKRLIGLGLRTDSAAWPSIDSLLLAKKGDWAKGVVGMEIGVQE
jgi:hypothetical protein